MRNRFNLILALLFVLAAGDTLRAQVDAFTVVRADARELIIEWIPEDYQATPVSIDGKTYYRYHSARAASTTEEGKPELPVFGFVVGLPPNSIAVADVIESRFEISQQQLVSPVPLTEIEGDETVRTRLKADEQFYASHNRWYPSPVVHVDEVAQIRDQRIAKIVVQPVQYNPVAKTLKRAVHLRVRIEFQEDFQRSEDEWIPRLGGAADDPHFEPVYRSLILNYEQAKQWRGVRRADLGSVQIDSTANWFVPGRQYYRIPVAKDGLYRVRAADFLAAGVNPTTIHFPSLAVYHKGRSIPVFVGNQGNPDSVFIDFYGERNRGDNSYFDLYSDTSAYFLTWNDTAARRFRVETSIPGPPQVQPSYYLEKLHHERDVVYFFGYLSSDLFVTDDVPGEGWYWAEFFPNNIRTYSFTIDSLVRGVGTGVLRVRLNGMSGFFSSPDHLAEFRINGTVLGQVGFNGNLEGLFVGSIPGSVLQIGSNTLEIRSITTQAPVNKFGLDWFEVEYPRPLRAVENELVFTHDAVPGGPAEFTVRGFDADSIDIFELTGGRKILGTVSGSPGATQIVFRDTLSVSKKYVVVGRQTRRAPAPLQPRTFRNLRARTNGADYLVITHPRFRTAANRLASHRRSVNRLRTTVVGIEEIYDEFGFGEKSVFPIRDFLRHAYYSWRAPSPTFVLLMGDASWDYRRNLSNSIKEDLLPSYGNPPSDNALVSLHPVKNYLPYMFIGRIPAEDSTQARRIVDKILAYENPPVSEWNKSFLFITGGTSLSERNRFNFYSNRYINNYVLPSPVGGIAHRVYKTSDAVIDGEFRDSIRNLIQRGLIYINFIGHSGGRIWNVDPGSPNDFGNTDGKLFFVNSVSCWIAFFSDPRSNVLAEDHLFADNRAAIGVWAASSLGTAVTGDILTTKLLAAMKQDYARSVGQMVTISLLNYWAINSVTTPTVIGVLNLHPLIGDPYTLMPLPLQPDLAFKDSALVLNTDRPTSDSTVTLKVRWWNYGLVPTDSVLLTITDSYTDETGVYRGTSGVIPAMMLPPTRAMDSVLISWDVRNRPGTHVLTARLDPVNKIPELTKANNTAEHTFYVYRNVVTALKPPAFTVVRSGPVTLTVTVPAGNDTTPLTYFFEIDTLPDFSSQWKKSSPAVLPNPVSAEWTTPPLADSGLFFWRTRTSDGNTFGAWEVSSFRTSDREVIGGRLFWDQRDAKQFVQNEFSSTTTTDSGVTLQRTNSVNIYARSVGHRASMDRDFYSIITIGNQTIIGHWWNAGNGFIIARINDYTGAFNYRTYDPTAIPAHADSMARFIQQTPPGHYVAITVIFNGRTTNQNLLQAIHSLGSAYIDQVLNGHSWAIIGRKGESGPLMSPVEMWSPDGVAICEYTIPSFYAVGAGVLLSPPIGPAHRWARLRWNSDVSPPGTSIQLKVLGLRQDGVSDTLFSLSPQQTSLDLLSLQSALYPQLRLVALLANTDPQYTPLLKSWSVEYDPPAELATSAWVFSASPSNVSQGVPINVSLDVHNIGYRRADSVRVRFSLVSSGSVLHEVAVDSIPVNGVRRVSAQVPTSDIPVGNHVLQTLLVPRQGENDLYAGNNAILFSFTVRAGKDPTSTVKILFDDREIMDGDYVSASPVIRVELRGEGVNELMRGVRESPVGESPRVTLDGEEVETQFVGNVDDRQYDNNFLEVTDPADRVGRRTVVYELRPQLSDGSHELRVYEGRRSDGKRLAAEGVRTAPPEGGEKKGSGEPFSSAPLAIVRFQVRSTPELLNVFNFPNPFSRETFFTFLMTGSRVPDEVIIRLYTVAGRLIRQIELSPALLQLGFNRIHWDGRDQDGNEVANGSYFYKVIMKSGDRSAEVVQRLAKLR